MQISCRQYHSSAQFITVVIPKSSSEFLWRASRPLPRNNWSPKVSKTGVIPRVMLPHPSTNFVISEKSTKFHLLLLRFEDMQVSVFVSSANTFRVQIVSLSKSVGSLPVVRIEGLREDQSAVS